MAWTERKILSMQKVFPHFGCMFFFFRPHLSPNGRVVRDVWFVFSFCNVVIFKVQQLKQKKRQEQSHDFQFCFCCNRCFSPLKKATHPRDWWRWRPPSLHRVWKNVGACVGSEWKRCRSFGQLPAEGPDLLGPHEMITKRAKSPGWHTKPTPGEMEPFFWLWRVGLCKITFLSFEWAFSSFELLALRINKKVQLGWWINLSAKSETWNMMISKEFSSSNGFFSCQIPSSFNSGSGP